MNATNVDGEVENIRFEFGVSCMDENVKVLVDYSMEKNISVGNVYF